MVGGLGILMNARALLNSPWFRPDWRSDVTMFHRELEHATKDCSIYILDPAVELAPGLGLTACNMSDPFFWPHNQDGKGIQAMPRTPHSAHQHGGGFWIAEALRASPLRVNDSRNADIIFVDMHCYHSWFISYLRRGEELEALGSPKSTMVAQLKELFSRPEQTRGGGSHLAYYLPIPASVTIYGQFLELEMRRSMELVLEQGFLGRSVREGKLRDHEALVLPYSSTEDIDPTLPLLPDSRDIFMFFRAGCSDSKDRSAGIIMRAKFIAAIESNSPPADVDVACTCSVCPGHISHRESEERLARSVYCPVLAGDTQASARLTEVVLAGCLPVFVGPPWHTMPLIDEIDYRTFGTFIRIADTTPYIIKDDTRGTSNIMRWTVKPEGDIEDCIIDVPTLADVLPALRRVHTSEREAKFAAMLSVKSLFWYPPMPGTNTSALGDVVIRHLCAHGKRATRLDKARGLPEGEGHRAGTVEGVTMDLSAIAEARQEAVRRKRKWLG